MTPPSRAWLRIFALVYDPFLWLGEIAGMRSRRRALLGSARGRVVEIGAGTGLNVAHYPDEIDELVLTEPDAAMRAQTHSPLQRQGASRGSSTRLLSAYRLRRRISGHRRLDARPLHRP